MGFLLKKELVYQGKAKELYQTTEENVLHVTYLDQATALNGQRKDQVVGKGQLNNEITSLIFTYLHQQQVDNHFIQQLSSREQLVRGVEMLPLEVVLRNVATGSFVKKFDVVEGTLLPVPIIEFYYKNDALDDPMMNEGHILALGLATEPQISELYQLTLHLNQVLQELFQKIGVTLVDFKVEYGVTERGELLLADEITPDTCRLWDMKTGTSLDKDVYRKGTGDLLTGYQEIFQRLQKVITVKK